MDAAATKALLVEAAIAAGAVINEIYAAVFDVAHKPDGSPVTEADQRAEAVILQHLRSSGLPVLAEESASTGRIPDLGSRFFVVDPLDGTKEFVKRNGEFTVNIALVDEGRPITGVVLAPSTGAGFYGGPTGAEAFEVKDGRAEHWRPIAVSLAPPLRVVASRSHGHAGLAALCETLGVEEDVSVGSSLKFCLLAAGKAQLYPRFTPTAEWDTAAGQAVLEAAGGVVLTLDGKPLGYGKSTAGFLNPYFVAAATQQQAEAAAGIMRRILG